MSMTKLQLIAAMQDKSGLTKTQATAKRKVRLLPSKTMKQALDPNV